MGMENSAHLIINCSYNKDAIFNATIKGLLNLHMSHFFLTGYDLVDVDPLVSSAHLASLLERRNDPLMSGKIIVG